MSDFWVSYLTSADIPKILCEVAFLAKCWSHDNRQGIL